jgi:hypothetical protein
MRGDAPRARLAGVLKRALDLAGPLPNALQPGCWDWPRRAASGNIHQLKPNQAWIALPSAEVGMSSKITSQHQKLEALVGFWRGEETHHPSPWDEQGGHATATVEARMAIGGMFLISDYVQQRGGERSFLGHGVYGWDAKEGCYTMYWFDSSGATPPARGQWQGFRLALENQSQWGYSRYVYEMVNADRYIFRMETSPDRAVWQCFIEGRFDRVEEGGE